MTASSISHVAISASAGSGKTFQLAHRYISLMANGVSPDRIIALTFSRKAAGEIFDSVVKYLCDASSSPEQARYTGRLIGKPEFRQQDFLQLLRSLLVRIHSLHISTLDSFTVSILKSFPMELGIPSAFEIMDNDSGEAKAAGRKVLGLIFNHRRVTEAAQQAFLDAFRQATFGQETKNLEQSLDTFITGFREYYCLMPEADMWGQESMVWPRGSPWLEPAGDVAQAAAELKATLPANGFPEDLLISLTEIIDFCSSYGESSRWDDGMSKKVVFTQLLANPENLERGQLTLFYRRGEYALSARQCQLVLNLLRHVLGIELRATLGRSQGIFQVLHQYEQFYDHIVRQRGQLTFTDAQYLLTTANRYSSGSMLSRMLGQEARLYIDYRLDCKLDHWLLDEFQDTSDLQWEVLRNLADEILQDASEGRSFFYVGDVKQAIYGWRGGNARLFGKILEQYQGRIVQIPLSVSFRSCQAVIDTVNRVFGRFPDDQLPPQAVAEWEKIWQEHRCQADVVPECGHVALLEPHCHNGEVKPTAEDRYHAVANLLNEMKPLDRGLSVAILVRTNDAGKDIVDFLRSECRGMPIIHEGRAAIKDNPAVSVLLALVKFAAHPGDTFAWRHLQMSPLNKYFAKHRLKRDDLPLLLLREIQTHGFQAFMRRWGARLNAVQQLDDFGRKRLNDLINAAGEFDRTAGRGCNDFLRFIDNYQLHELGTDNAVRVMTIHQSKGLGFDIVILPDLEKGNMARASHPDFVIARDPGTDRPLWTLKMPRAIVAESDPVLAAQVQKENETACFDFLCLLYVALTRAKQGLYMITCFPGKGSRVVTPATLLKTQLAGDPRPTSGPGIEIGGEEFTCLYETGERDWYIKAPSRPRPAKPAEPPELSTEFGTYPSLRRRLLGVSPSTIEGREIRADLLFAHVTHDSIEFGQAIHELFEKVSWIDEVDIEGLIRDWQETSYASEEIRRSAVEQFRQALASPEVRQALSRPSGAVALWREKHFEIVLEDQWITGVFDRVTISRDQGGRPLRATILDFKSNEITDDAELASTAERYRPQLLLYGRALSRMLQVDSPQVALQLLFTCAGKVYRL
jgi:ATP-dependent helicase/nuclease subunit A